MPALFLRLIAACPTPSAIEALDHAAQDTLRAWQPAADQAPAPYAKLDGHVEFSYHLFPGTAVAHAAVTALEPAGWNHTTPDADVSCVWNRAPGRHLVHPAVVWAELGFVEAGDAPSDGHG